MVGEGKYACCFHNADYETSTISNSLDHSRYAGSQVRSFVESLGEKMLSFDFIHSSIQGLRKCIKSQRLIVLLKEV